MYDLPDLRRLYIEMTQILKQLREERALSRRDLAYSSGVHEITIYRVEHGKSTPRPSTIRKLAKALDVSPRDIIAIGDKS